MATFNVTIKHKGQKYDVEVDPASTGEVFKYQLFSLTGVEPERQKVLIKGGQLKDDAEMGKLGLTPGQSIMMMGTPGETGQLVRPTEKPKFVEDMTEAEQARQEGATPAGLVNLGNTCYLNSTLQTLRLIPELQDALAGYNFRASAMANSMEANMPQLDLTNQLKDLYKSMAETQGGYTPMAFLAALRVAFPQFAERAKQGHGFAQQDAEEAWSQIIAQLRQKLQVTEGSGDDAKSVSFIDRYMSGEFVSKLEVDDEAAREGGEEPVVSRETFLKLNCHIDSSINHLRDGILSGLKEKIEKKSSVLDRDTTYTKTSQIARLPKYLTVHFVRFFWKRDTQKKAKIMRKVTFPDELDMVEFCTDDLRKALIPVRDKLREIVKDEEDMERARKRRKKNPLLDGEPSEGASGSNAKKEEKKKGNDKKTSADGDTEMTETFKTDAEFEAEHHTALETAKKELRELMNPELARDEGANQSGLYELRGVVTHQGASADSGHYTAYVKKTAPAKDPVTGEKGVEDGNWWWFNDDKVSEVPADKIATLAGGGESHSALILLYRAVPLPTEEGSSE